MRPSLLVFALNSTSAQWCVDLFSKRHTAMLSLERCRPVISKTTHFRCWLYLMKHAAWNGVMVLVLRKSVHFSRKYFHIFVPVTLIFDSWSQICLPVTPGVSNLSSKSERCMVFRFRVRQRNRPDRQTDELTDGMGVMRNAASLKRAAD